MKIVAEFFVEVVPGIESAGVLNYVAREHSFSFLGYRGRLHPEGLAAVCIGTLQVSVDVSSGDAIYVDGLKPKSVWIERTLFEPAQEASRVTFKPVGFSFEPGIGYPYADSAVWETHFDPVSGWVCVGDSTLPTAASIASGTALSIDQRQVRALWLRPDLWA